MEAAEAEVLAVEFLFGVQVDCLPPPCFCFWGEVGGLLEADCRGMGGMGRERDGEREGRGMVRERRERDGEGEGR